VLEKPSLFYGMAFPFLSAIDHSRFSVTSFFRTLNGANDRQSIVEKAVCGTEELTERPHRSDMILKDHIL